MRVAAVVLAISRLRWLPDQSMKWVWLRSSQEGTYVKDYVTPRWDRSALVVIDLQRDFLDDGQAAIQGTTDVVPKVASLVKAFRRAGRPVVHIVRLYSPGSSDVDLLRRAVIEAGPRWPRRKRADRKSPKVFSHKGSDWTQNCFSQERYRPSARAGSCFSSHDGVHFIAPILSRSSIDRIVTLLPNCPRATLFDASERDFRTVPVTDACRRRASSG